MDTNELLEELMTRYYLPPIGDGDVTIKMLERVMKVNYERAKAILEGEVSAGRLQAYDARDAKGHKVTAYRKKTPA